MYYIPETVLVISAALLFIIPRRVRQYFLKNVIMSNVDDD